MISEETEAKAPVFSAIYRWLIKSAPENIDSEADL